MQWFDDFFERKTRQVARMTSRRNAMARLGRALLGASVLFPVLPFDRSPQAAPSGHGGGGAAPPQGWCPAVVSQANAEDAHRLTVKTTMRGLRGRKTRRQPMASLHRDGLSRLLPQRMLPGTRCFPASSSEPAPESLAWNRAS